MKINLIPEVKQEQLKIKKLNLTVTTFATVVGVILVSAAAIMLVAIGTRAAQIASIERDIKEVENELVSYQKLEATVISLETGLKEIKQVLAGGPKWSKFFAELEKATPADVQIVNFNIRDQQITLNLVGKDVKSIDRTIKSFSNYKVDGEKQLFSDVAVSSFTKKDGNLVSFQAEMNFIQGVLW